MREHIATIDKSSRDEFIETKIKEIKCWYNGYNTNSGAIYNPFSVTTYLSKNFVPKPYWCQTENLNILQFMSLGDDIIKFL